MGCNLQQQKTLENLIYLGDFAHSYHNIFYYEIFLHNHSIKVEFYSRHILKVLNEDLWFAYCLCLQSSY